MDSNDFMQESVKMLLATKDPAEKAAILADLILRELPEAVASVAHRCVIFHWFNISIIEVLLNEFSLTQDEIRKVCEQLEALPFIETLPWGLTFQDLTREGLLKRYTAVQPDWLKSVALQAASVYEIHSDDKVAAEAAFCYVLAGNELLGEPLIDKLTKKALERGDQEFVHNLQSLLDEARQIPFVGSLPLENDQNVTRTLDTNEAVEKNAPSSVISHVRLSNPLEIFQIEGWLAEEIAIFLEEVHGVGATRSASGEISTPFREKSFFSLGELLVLPLAQLLAERGQSVSADIRLQMQDYDFYQVQLACTFQAAPGCRFNEVRLLAKLQTTDPVSVQTVIPGAITHDLFPLFFEEARKVSFKKGLNSRVAFDFDRVSSSVSLPLCEQSETDVTYTSHVEAFNLGSSQPGWKFMHTPPHEIRGTQKLFMIVRKPKGTQVHVTFELEAFIQFKFGEIADFYPLVMRFRHRNSPSTITDKPTIPLC